MHILLGFPLTLGMLGTAYEVLAKNLHILGILRISQSDLPLKLCLKRLYDVLMTSQTDSDRKNNRG